MKLKECTHNLSNSLLFYIHLLSSIPQEKQRYLLPVLLTISIQICTQKFHELIFGFIVVFNFHQLQELSVGRLVDPKDNHCYDVMGSPAMLATSSLGEQLLSIHDNITFDPCLLRPPNLELCFKSVFGEL